MLVLILMGMICLHADAVTVQVQCSDSNAVAGTEIKIYKLITVDRHEVTTFLKKEGPLAQSGSRAVTVEPGKYFFIVMGKNTAGQNVFLSSDTKEIKDNTTITLSGAPPQTLSLSHENRKMQISRATIRADQMPSSDAMPLSVSTPVIISAKQPLYVRVSAKSAPEDPQVIAELWEKVSKGSLSLSLANTNNSFCRFSWIGDKKVTVNFYFPVDTLTFEATTNTLFVTNRRFVEMNYSYPIPEGTLVTYRNNYVLQTKNNLLRLGGPFEPSGYARFMMKWGPNSLMWGVDLINAGGDMINPSASTINWKCKLARRDGKAIPQDTEAVTLEDMKAVKPGFTEWGQFNYSEWKDWPETLATFQMEIAYQMNGLSVTQTVYPEAFVPWKSAHITIEVPRRWKRGMASAYLDKMERMYTYGGYIGVSKPKGTYIRWSNQPTGGFSTMAEYTDIQLAFVLMRNTMDFYTIDNMWIHVHEFMHTFGYVHGGPMDEAIGKGLKLFEDHRAWLEDHPDYMPEPYTIVQELSGPDAVVEGMNTLDQYYEKYGAKTPKSAAQIRGELLALLNKYRAPDLNIGKADNKTAGAGDKKNNEGKVAAKKSNLLASPSAKVPEKKSIKDKIVAGPAKSTAYHEAERQVKNILDKGHSVLKQELSKAAVAVKWVE